jgi:hypothetical protein
MPELHEVFGISTSIPKYTYVNRAGLDERFLYLLGSDRHIVIYGPSKQGKTILRKKVLPEERCVVVPAVRTGQSRTYTKKCCVSLAQPSLLRRGVQMWSVPRWKERPKAKLEYPALRQDN